MCIISFKNNLENVFFTLRFYVCMVCLDIIAYIDRFESERKREMIGVGRLIHRRGIKCASHGVLFHGANIESTKEKEVALGYTIHKHPSTKVKPLMLFGSVAMVRDPFPLSTFYKPKPTPCETCIVYQSCSRSTIYVAKFHRISRKTRLHTIKLARVRPKLHYFAQHYVIITLT